MYRIELGPDDIGVFRSIEEMATGIKTGVITPKARIYHSASDKWLPIEFHPHFKKAREMAAGGVPPAPPTPAPVRVTAPEIPRRQPSPAPSPVAGLPLIDVSAPAKPVEPEPPPVMLRVPEPVALVHQPAAPEPQLPALIGPGPVQPEPITHERSTPAPFIPAYVPPEPVVRAYVAPEPVPACLAPVLPMLEREPEPALADAEAVEAGGPIERTEPEPYELPPAPVLVVSHEPEPAPYAPVIPPLPEPEREAIFLAVPKEADPVEAGLPEREPDVVEPASEEPRIAEPLPSFQLPRVDLRLGQRRRPALIAAAAAVLAVSTHFALSSDTTRWELGIGVPLPDLGPRTLRAERPIATAPTNATVLPASVPPAKGSPSFGGASAFTEPKPVVETVAPAPPVDTAVRPPVPEVAPPPKIAIAAPKTGAAPSLEGDLKSAAGLVTRYEAAHAAARAELENGLKTAGFANLFATTRLQPAGLRAARASVGTASAYVQRYRRREAEIEEAYRDTFNLLSISSKWSDGQRRTWESRKVHKEHPEVVKLSSFLLQSLDSLYGLLSAQEGGYRLGEGTITFDEAAASRAYAELRPWLERRAHGWADANSGEPTTAARILQAMGTVKLPEGGSL
jgi:hypothetical protein